MSHKQFLPVWNSLKVITVLYVFVQLALVSVSSFDISLFHGY